MLVELTMTRYNKLQHELELEHVETFESKTQVDLSKVTYISESFDEEMKLDGSNIYFDSGDSLYVKEDYKTLASMREKAKKGFAL